MESQVDKYFDEIDLADELRKAGKTREALKAALRNVRRVPELIRETISEYGGFDIGSVPPIETGCTLAAVLGDALALGEIRKIVNGHSALEPFRKVVDQGYENLESVRTIRSHLEANPGCLQSELGKTLGLDGRRVAGLVHQLELAGFVRRDKASRSYALFSSTTASAPS